MTEARQNEGSGEAPRGAGATLSLLDRELIDGYLAGRLDQATRDQVEARIVGDAVFRGEVELTEQLRAGLRDLDARGQLDSGYVPKRPPFWQRPVVALAASVAAGLLGLMALALHEQWQRGRVQIVQLQQALGRLQPETITGLRVLSVTRTRAAGGEPDLVVRPMARNELLELRIDAGPEPATAYRVTLDSVAGGAGATLLSVAAAATSSEGEVVLAINPALVPPGDYTLALVPADPAAADSIRYRIRVEK